MSSLSSVQRPEDLAAQENLLARLDRMPVNREILFLVGLLGVIWILEAFDIGIIAPVLFILKGEWQLSPSATGLVGSAGTLGIVLGLLPAGRLADRFGRKTTLVGGIIVFSIVTFLASFSHDATQLAIFRFVAGLGQGAVFPVPYLLLSEFVNKQWRGTAVGLANSLLGFSYGLNTLAGALVVGHMPAGQAWVTLLMLGGLPIVIVPIIIKYLPGIAALPAEGRQNRHRPQFRRRARRHQSCAARRKAHRPRLAQSARSDRAAARLDLRSVPLPVPAALRGGVSRAACRRSSCFTSSPSMDRRSCSAWAPARKTRCITRRDCCS